MNLGWRLFSIGTNLLSLNRKTMHMLELSSCPLHPSDPWKMFKPAIHVLQRSCGKVMFSVVSVCSGGGGVPMWWLHINLFKLHLGTRPGLGPAIIPAYMGPPQPWPPPPTTWGHRPPPPACLNLLTWTWLYRDPPPCWHSTEMLSCCKLLRWNIKTIALSIN